MKTFFLFIISFIIFLSSCNVTRVERQLTPPEAYRTLDQKSPFLKAHLKNGEVILFSNWFINDTTKHISGEGEAFDINRNPVETGHFNLAIDSVALFESNTIIKSPAAASLTVLAGLSAALSVYCLTNPKACFGSCPTFYASDGEKPIIQAEGFSASISPALEAKDVDALYRANLSSKNVPIRMTNEAMETHVVRYSNLLAVPREVGERVLQTPDGAFYRSSRFILPESAENKAKKPLGLFLAFDGEEYFTEADSTDLATREEVIFTFPETKPGKYGVTLAFRQSLLSTFLLYQTMAYMGSKTAEWLSYLERNKTDAIKLAKGIGERLGGIEIFVETPAGTWERIGEINETGPIATDIQTMIIPESYTEINKIKLRLTRGHWRLDYVALAQLDLEAAPIRLMPEHITFQNKTDAPAREKLLNPEDFLVTFPGDVYELTYQLPNDGKHYELFLETQGYYLEWIRESWIKEEDEKQAAMIFFRPDQALKELAPAYKKVEATMEETFWGSRYVNP